MRKNTQKMQHIWPRAEGTTFPYRTFLERSRWVKMLSSNWHVTLRLNVFETFAVKWQKIGVWEAQNGHNEALLDPAFGYP